MLQDREVPVSLLVGAKYGMSQIINHKLNVISTLVEFSSISRVELLSESEKVSLLRISLHDMKPFALLMDSLAAKDLACLLGGYCRLLVDPNVNVFRLGRPKVRVHRIPAEEGYVSRCCSDSEEESSDDDDPMDSHRHDPASQDWEERRREAEVKRREEDRQEREEHQGKQEVKIIVTTESREKEGEEGASGSGLKKFTVMDEDINRENNWYHTDPRVTCSFSSLSSGSLSAALDDSSSSASAKTAAIDVHHPYLLEPKAQQAPLRPTNLNYCGADNSYLCFTDLSNSDFMPSPAGATSDDDDDDDEEEEEHPLKSMRRISKIPSSRDLRMIDSTPFNRSPIKKKKTPPKVPVRTSSIPGNKATQAERRLSKDEDAMQLTPSPNSEEEFFDAKERFTPPVPDLSDKEFADRCNANRLSGSWNGFPSSSGKAPPSPLATKSSSVKKEVDTLKTQANQLHKQQPSPPKPSPKREIKVKPPVAPKPQLPPKPKITPQKSPQKGQSYAHCNGDASGRISSDLLEMEPETMEFKSVTSGAGGLPLSSPLITAVRYSQQPPPAHSNKPKKRGR
ncbi:hypothetical protein WMY93_009676 [Mugilogobius chulae]|uniref:FAK1-like FERM domain-containing protein n=1 Tax=Mugilogobius chulae TaxID=88201 RepID=A0AAW0PC62_9GOBI